MKWWPLLLLGSVSLHSVESLPKPVEQENVFVSGEYLYWKSSEPNLAYVKLGTSALLPTTQDQLPGTIYTANFDWDPGIRVAVGCKGFLNRWVPKVVWTGFHNKGFNSMTGLPPQTGTILQSGETLRASGFLPGYAVNATEAISKLNLRFNFVDFELSRQFNPSRSVVLDCFASIRTGWINQVWQAQYKNSVIVSAPPSGQVFSLVANSMLNHTGTYKQKFQGTGIRLGGSSKWDMFGGFSVYGSGAGSLLYGRFYDSTRVTSTTYLNLTTPNLAGSSLMYTEQFSVELRLGLSWDKDFRDHQNHIQFQVGWEYQGFPDHIHFFYFPQILSSNTDQYRTSLTIQGLTASAQLDF